MICVQSAGTQIVPAVMIKKKETILKIKKLVKLTKTVEEVKTQLEFIVETDDSFVYESVLEKLDSVYNEEFTEDTLKCLKQFIEYYKDDINAKYDQLKG